MGWSASRRPEPGEVVRVRGRLAMETPPWKIPLLSAMRHRAEAMRGAARGRHRRMCVHAFGSRSARGQPDGNEKPRRIPVM
jgi:hypothetical protein